VTVTKAFRSSMFILDMDGSDSLLGTDCYSAERYNSFVVDQYLESPT